MNGYCGNVLRIDLTAGTVKVEALDLQASNFHHADGPVRSPGASHSTDVSQFDEWIHKPQSYQCEFQGLVHESKYYPLGNVPVESV